MADLQIIDDIVDEICKIRGVDMPPICVKMITLSYLMYCCNTYDVKYKNEDGYEIRTNSGCIVLCQKGTGKSRTLKALKNIFKSVDEERRSRYNKKKACFVGRYAMNEGRELPSTKSNEEALKKFELEHGSEPIMIFDDPITAKGLCETYGQMKKYHVNNLLFTVDEAGDRLFRDAFSKDPSFSAREFVQAINQLFDGYCGMGKSKASKAEGIQSQSDVGANFIFVSTAEFLKDYQVQQRYESAFEGGIARRLLYVNCPPIDKMKVDRKRYNPDFEQFIPIAQSVFNGVKGHSISVSNELWQILEQEGAGANITIDDEFLLLLFCTVLALWTGEKEIKPYHWEYMIKTWQDIKKLSMTVIQKDTTSYDKICVFMREYFEKNKKKDKMPLALIKDFCLRNRMCFENQYKRWFDGLCRDFAGANASRYIIDKNQMYAWLEENFAYNE